jgi:hypothetical protein
LQSYIAVTGCQLLQPRPFRRLGCKVGPAPGVLARLHAFCRRYGFVCFSHRPTSPSPAPIHDAHDATAAVAEDAASRCPHALSLLSVRTPDDASSNSPQCRCLCRLLLNCSTPPEASTAAPSLQPATRAPTSSPSQGPWIPSRNGSSPAPSLRAPTQQIPQAPIPLERDSPMRCPSKPCSPDRRCDTSNGQCVCKPGWYVHMLASGCLAREWGGADDCGDSTLCRYGVGCSLYLLRSIGGHANTSELETAVGAT